MNGTPVFACVTLHSRAVLMARERERRCWQLSWSGVTCIADVPGLTCGAYVFCFGGLVCFVHLYIYKNCCYVFLSIWKSQSLRYISSRKFIVNILCKSALSSVMNIGKKIKVL